MFGKSAYKQIAPSELNSKYVREANKIIIIIITIIILIIIIIIWSGM